MIEWWIVPGAIVFIVIGIMVYADNRRFIGKDIAVMAGMALIWPLGILFILAIAVDSHHDG